MIGVMSPRLLIALPQFPYDPASGAARTATTTGELLAQAGFSVRTIGTTASEGRATVDVAVLLADLNIDVSRRTVRNVKTLSFMRRWVSYTLLDAVANEASQKLAYDRVFDECLSRFQPDILFTYGGSPKDVERQRRARSNGVRVVFGLYNTGYVLNSFFSHVDGVVTPSQFLSDFYLRSIGLRSTPLPTPLWIEDVVVKTHSPTVLTMVNPAPEKGLMFFAKLAHTLGKECPNIPIEVYASRGSASFLMQAAFSRGIDLSTHPGLTLKDTTANPCSIYSRCRAIVVPSLVEDAAPRVVAEAFVNGVPPLGSDRGGIPEMCRNGGFVLPIPRTLTPHDLQVPRASAIRPWVNAIDPLFNDSRAWNQASARARRAGAKFHAPGVTKAYVEYFERLLGK